MCGQVCTSTHKEKMRFNRKETQQNEQKKEKKKYVVMVGLNSSSLKPVSEVYECCNLLDQ